MGEIAEIDDWYKSAYRALCEEMGVDRLTYDEAYQLTNEYTQRHLGLIAARDRIAAHHEKVEGLKLVPPGECRVCRKEIPPTGQRGRPPVVCLEGDCREIYYKLKPDERKMLAYVQGLEGKGETDPFVTVGDLMESVLEGLANREAE